MIGYVTLGTNDLDKAAAFYDSLLGSIDIGRCLEQPGQFIAWAKSPDAPSVSVTVPFDGKKATVEAPTTQATSGTSTATSSMRSA
jgi:catechol 2,3-dioxygenase-like lactoylglutathione lyase family enzyme